MNCGCEELGELGGGCLPRPDLGDLVPFGEDDLGALAMYGDDVVDYDFEEGDVEGLLDDAWNYGKKLVKKIGGGDKRAQRRARNEQRRADRLQDQLADERRKQAEARRREAHRREISAKERELATLRAQQANVRNRRERLAEKRRSKYVKYGAIAAGVAALGYGGYKLATNRQPEYRDPGRGRRA